MVTPGAMRALWRVGAVGLSGCKPEAAAPVRPTPPAPSSRAAWGSRTAPSHALAPGDTYAFGEPADAAFVNEGRAPCVHLVAVSRR